MVMRGVNDVQHPLYAAEIWLERPSIPSVDKNLNGPIAATTTAKGYTGTSTPVRHLGTNDSGISTAAAPQDPIIGH